MMNVGWNQNGARSVQIHVPQSNTYVLGPVRYVSGFKTILELFQVQFDTSCYDVSAMVMHAYCREPVSLRF